MVVLVWRQASKARSLSRVVGATADERIVAPVREAGGDAIMPPPAPLSGTDRIAEVATLLPADIYVNVQGDLPFIEPDDLDALVAPMRTDDTIAMATLATPIIDGHEWNNPNVVKVVCDADGNALYFSRSPIPHLRDGAMPKEALRHIGVYAYRRDFLMKFATLAQGVLERLEKTEQCGALEHVYKIETVASVNTFLPTATPTLIHRAA